MEAGIVLMVMNLMDKEREYLLAYSLLYRGDISAIINLTWNTDAD